MQKFQFRLQQVLEYRSHLESEQKDRLALEKNKLDTLVHEENRLNGELSHWSGKYLQSMRVGVTPEEAIRIHYYMKELDRLLEENSRQIVRQEAQVEQTRLELVEKMKDRKTMEALYDKQKGRFITEELRKEERNIEEIIISRLPGMEM